MFKWHSEQAAELKIIWMAYATTLLSIGTENFAIWHVSRRYLSLTITINHFFNISIEGMKRRSRHQLQKQHFTQIFVHTCTHKLPPHKVWCLWPNIYTNWHLQYLHKSNIFKFCTIDGCLKSKQACKPSNSINIQWKTA